MDLNGDGNIDLLSGSYSRRERDMAGLFQVMWGKDKGGFEQCSVLTGDDGKPLIIPADRKKMTDKICTRPTAVDLDGDGKLDIVSGNFRGTFAVFTGSGGGQFEAEPSWLEKSGKRLSAGAHSDPFFIDWDGDGDLDMLSGASQGGVFLFENEGSVTKPEFGLPSEVLAAPTDRGARLGDAAVVRPGGSTRVFAGDVNGDGKFDLLIGDRVTVRSTAKGQEAEADGFRAVNGDHKNQQKRTGFVWVMYQK